MIVGGTIPWLGQYALESERTLLSYWLTLKVSQ